jgi:xanthine dehydrogenase small subunit
MYDYGSEARNADDHWMNCSFSSPGDRQPSRGEREMVERLQSIERRDTLTLESPTRRYFAPTRLSDLASLRERYPDARMLAGGTDIGLRVTKQYRDLGEILYVGNVAELRSIVVTDTHIEVGAGASLTDAFAVIATHYPELDELFRRFASPPIRNAGTLGGNIANASPIGDSMPALIALDSTLVLRKGTRVREVPLDAFYIAYQKTVLEAGEFVERIRVPRPDPAAYLRSYKLSKRFDQDISAVCGAYRIIVADGEVASARIAYGGMAATPRRAAACERALVGRPWTEAAVCGAMQALDGDFTPLTDMRASAAYRRQAARNLLYRFWLETSGQQVATRVDAVTA